MSKDPSTTPPPKGGTPQTLEDAVYRSSLAEGNRSVRGANPVISLFASLATYGLVIGVVWVAATQTKAGQQIVKKTMGIDLTEEAEEDIPPPPPPPPPAPAAPVVVAKIEKPVDTPPPPPPNPDQETVPEIAPREIPKTDMSTAYAVAQGTPGAGGGVAGGGVAGTGMSIAGAGSGGAAKVVDFDYTQMVVKSKPASLNYPPIARMAKIQGAVTVQMVVGVDGVPISAKAVDGPVQLRPTSEQYAMQWRFEPAMQNGVPVQSRFQLTINFRLNN